MQRRRRPSTISQRPLGKSDAGDPPSADKCQSCSDPRVLKGQLRRDEENPYLTAKAPMAGGPPTMGQRFWKELRQNWWLWGSVIFAILLVGGLLLFRNQLYDSATHGLPFLAGVPLSPAILVTSLLSTEDIDCSASLYV